MTRRGNGFTLIEMLVSLGALGLMATMLLGGVHQVGSYLRRTDDRAVAQQQLIAAQRILRSRLEQLRPVTRADSAIPTVDARGDGGNFSFLAPPLDRAAPAALWRYRVTVTAAGDLVLYWANSLDDRFDLEAGTAGWRPIILARDVGAMRIDYFGEESRSKGRRWLDRWIARPQPPDLIRIRVTFRGDERRLWPDLVVRPRATVNTACKIAALTGRCEEAL